MKKKKQKNASTGSVSVASAEVLGDIESLIHSHSEFFDRLIELIPPRFYLSNEDDAKPWYQGLTKAAKASMKQQSKQNLKLARRQRFNPDKEPASTLDMLNQKNLSIDLISEPSLGEDTELPVKPIDVENNKEKSVTYEELREKLRRKIELLRGNRGEKKTDEKTVKSEVNKRKRNNENGGDPSEIQHDEEEDDEEIIEYGRVELGDRDELKKKKKRKLSKAKELEKAKKLQEVKKVNPTVGNRESWKAATSRAMGMKVHDDARFIKDSIVREKRKKEKNAEKWKDRVETQEKVKKEKQQKRKQNIVERINDKKMRKIAKRENKLLRLGFEGRKEGYITNQ